MTKRDRIKRSLLDEARRLCKEHAAATGNVYRIWQSRLREDILFTAQEGTIVKNAKLIE